MCRAVAALGHGSARDPVAARGGRPTTSRFRTPFANSLRINEFQMQCCVPPLDQRALMTDQCGNTIIQLLLAQIAISDAVLRICACGQLFRTCIVSFVFYPTTITIKIEIYDNQHTFLPTYQKGYFLEYSEVKKTLHIDRVSRCERLMAISYDQVQCESEWDNKALKQIECRWCISIIDISCWHFIFKVALEAASDEWAILNGRSPLARDRLARLQTCFPNHEHPGAERQHHGALVALIFWPQQQHLLEN